jgi:hypothetical protein
MEYMKMKLSALKNILDKEMAVFSEMLANCVNTTEQFRQCREKLILIHQAIVKKTI